MDITIHQAMLPHDDPDASLAFYRDALDFEVHNDEGYPGMPWITVGPSNQPETSIVLYPPAATPGLTDEERRTVAEMMEGHLRQHQPVDPEPRRHLRTAGGQRRGGGPRADRPAVRAPRLRLT